jgi:HlyD family secretion protein
MPSISNKRIIWISVVVLIMAILAAVGSRQGWWGQTSPMEVAVEKVEARDLVETVLASGKIQPITEVKISSEVSGEIVVLNIKEGEPVRKGQLLARINPEMMAAALDRNEAAVNNAKSGLATARVRLRQLQNILRLTVEPAYKRTAKLYEDKVATQAEWEAARSQYESAQQDIESALQTVEGAEFMVQSAQASQKEMREQLARTNILAPMDGIVTKLSVELGERVVGTIQMAGTEMIRIADLTKMEVRVDVSESDVVRVKDGDSVKLEVDAYPGRTFEGVVREIANSSSASALPGTGGADQVTNFMVKISMLGDNQGPNFLFRPGMSASAEITTRRVSGALSLPINAVTLRDQDGQPLGTGNDSGTEGSGDNESGDNARGSSGEQAALKHAGGFDGTDREVVFVRKGDSVEQRTVVSGIQDDRYIQIVNGLKAGEEVVVAPYSAVSRDLTRGRKVKVVARDDLFQSGD